MSDYIPFEMQSEIIKRLPVKSLLRFRSVSKQYKSFIDNPEFIKTYHINHPNPKHHLLVRHNDVPTYTSIIDDNTFPRQKFPLTPPEPFNSLRYPTKVGSIDGLICFYGLYQDVVLKTNMIVLWNPSVRKCVGIPIPILNPRVRLTMFIAFGACPDTNDPKLVKINLTKRPSRSWDVQVFTLGSRVWKNVLTIHPFPLASRTLMSQHVCVDGIIYWSTNGGSFILSFDLKSDKFGQVFIPERFVPTNDIRVAKVNDSLCLIEYIKEADMSVCGVWMRKDGVDKPFTKIYTIKVEGKSVLNRVLEFRNNGQVLLQLDDDDYDDSKGSEMEVYEPSSGCINSVGISGRRFNFRVWSYVETLLLLDQSNSIIH